MNFYKHYIGDYQRDTGHLSLAEHGAYRLMLDAFYATGKPLPMDKKALYRLLRAATAVERKAIDMVCAQFWEISSAGLVNRRAALEIEKAAKQAEINRQIAIEREKRKRQRLEEIPVHSPCIKTGMEELVGKGAFFDPVHESDKVFEVCRVNNTHIVSGMQPFSCTNRATDGPCPVEPGEDVEGGLSRVPIHNQSHSHSHSQNHNHNKKECGNPATSLWAGENADSGEALGQEGDENAAAHRKVLFSGGQLADIVLADTDDFPDKGFSGDAAVETGSDVPDSHDDDSHKTKSVSVSLAMAMRKAGIVAAAGDPRLLELARQGVDVDTVVAACSEARRARPNERIGMAYVVKIVERWARDASSIAARGARAHGRSCVHEDRRKALDELTGRSPDGVAPSVSGVPFTFDGSVKVIGGDDGKK